MKNNKIMVPLDGSELAESALVDAFDLVAEDGVVVLMRAAEAHGRPGSDPITALIDVVAEAEQYLSALKSELEGPTRHRDPHLPAAPVRGSHRSARGRHGAQGACQMSRAAGGEGLAYGAPRAIEALTPATAGL